MVIHFFHINITSLILKQGSYNLKEKQKGKEKENGKGKEE